MESYLIKKTKTKKKDTSAAQLYNFFTLILGAIGVHNGYLKAL